MDWLNLRVSTLKSPPFINSGLMEKATWLGVLAYCVQQENSGVIVGGFLWKNQQWQQVCGATVRQIRAANKLLSIVGNDIVVFGYPKDKEQEVQARRLQAGEAARRRWEKELGIKGDASRNAPRIPPRNAEGEGEIELPLYPQGDLNSSSGFVSDTEQSKRPRRSPERRLSKAKEELEDVERELEEIVRPGGCAYTVAPTGEKEALYKRLMAQRSNLKTNIAAARAEISKAETD